MRDELRPVDKFGLDIFGGVGAVSTVAMCSDGTYKLHI